MSIADSIKELLFPPRCQSCDKQLAQAPPTLLCAGCRSLLSPISSPLCPKCGTPYQDGEDHLCGVCLENVFAFEQARSMFLYQEPVITLLARFKFAGRLSGLDTLTHLVKESGPPLTAAEPDLILPVPLHLQRLRERGFNQSLLIARACFPMWSKKIKTDLLLRRQATTPQTRLSGRARRSNLRGAFSISRPERIAGKTILIVDDVFTTGSTLHECAKPLAEAGAATIEAFTLARAL